MTWPTRDTLPHSGATPRRSNCQSRTYIAGKQREPGTIERNCAHLGKPILDSQASTVRAVAVLTPHPVGANAVGLIAGNGGVWARPRGAGCEVVAQQGDCVRPERNPPTRTRFRLP